jgi:hypothetical protein
MWRPVRGCGRTILWNCEMWDGHVWRNNTRPSRTVQKTRAIYSWCSSGRWWYTLSTDSKYAADWWKPWPALAENDLRHMVVEAIEKVGFEMLVTVEGLLLLLRGITGVDDERVLYLLEWIPWMQGLSFVRRHPNLTQVVWRDQTLM